MINCFKYSLILSFLCIYGSAVFADDSPKMIHVFVALCDNVHQGIVPVPKRLGDGDDPANNLYWGAMYGVKSYFKSSKDWKLLGCLNGRKDKILESCIFKNKNHDVYLIADAYKGEFIKNSIRDFIESSGCNYKDSLKFDSLKLQIGGKADLIAYVGHDGLMDFDLESLPNPEAACHKDAIILACASKYYFTPLLRNNNSNPILWTTNLMAPEAYTLKAAIDGWINGEDNDKIVRRAAEAYSSYQKCSLKSAAKLFTHGYND